MPCAHVNVWPAIVVCGVGAEDVNSEVPTRVVEDKSVRMSFAKRTAPSILSSPAPCSSELNFASGCAEYSRIILIIFGVKFGFASNNTATAPATIGAETEVPLRRILPLPLFRTFPTQRSG